MKNQTPVTDLQLRNLRTLATLEAQGIFVHSSSGGPWYSKHQLDGRALKALRRRDLIVSDIGTYWTYRVTSTGHALLKDSK